MRARQSEIERRGSCIFELVDKHPEPLFSKAGFYQRLMALSMRDERFKVQLFRFVDVLPSLRHSREIIEHLNEYFSDDGFGPFVGTSPMTASGPLLALAFIWHASFRGRAAQSCGGMFPEWRTNLSPGKIRKT